MKAEAVPIECTDDVPILASISELMGSSLPFDEVILAALRSTQAAVGADGSSLLLIDRKEDNLNFYIALGEKAYRLKSLTLARGEGIAGYVAETGLPLIVSDAARDPRFSQRADQTTGFKTRAVACVPLRIRDDLTGVVEVVSQSVGAFAQKDLEVLTAIGGPIAIMLDNARLINEVKDLHGHLGEAIAERWRVALNNSRLFEQVKEQAAELEKASRVKSEFLGIMSHELKTPLYVIMGYAEVMRDKLLADSDKGLAKIIQYSQDLMTLIDSILTATKVEAGGVSAVKEETDLKALLDELKSLYDSPLGGDVAVVWDLPARLPRITTDGWKLKHILQNLVNNAIKYTERGTVTVTARLLSESEQPRIGETENPLLTGFPVHPLAGSAAGRWVEFRVSDTGIGIPRGEISAIFEMFRQMEGGLKKSRGGVGLGLYIVKSFTEILGGNVQVESEPGKGSIFTVTLPC